MAPFLIFAKLCNINVSQGTVGLWESIAFASKVVENYFGKARKNNIIIQDINRKVKKIKTILSISMHTFSARHPDQLVAYLPEHGLTDLYICQQNS